MIVSSALRRAREEADRPVSPTPVGGVYRYTPTRTKAGPRIDQDSSMAIATAYRAVNILSDDIAKLPLQMFRGVGSQKDRVRPDSKKRNLPYLLEISPNLWGWTPFQFKKVWAQWMILWGNAYVWRPPVWPFELYILPADVTYPVFDEADGSLWYATQFSNGLEYLPGPEVLHTLINPERGGFSGRGVVEFARESLGRQRGAYDTQSNLYKNGMNPSAYMQVSIPLDSDGRKKYRDSYGEVMSADYEGVRLAVLDNKITKFEPITMRLVDAQFLELMNANDRDIANFFGMPLNMLNMGKQSYNGNEQKFLEYLNVTLDGYLVQIEQGARVRWVAQADQDDTFLKFNRDALLRMEGKTRAETNEILIRSGQRTPNEVREKDDQAAYPGGDAFYMTKNYADVRAQNLESDKVQ